MIADVCGVDVLWLLTGEGEMVKRAGGMAAAGSAEEAARGAEEEVDAELGLEYYRDRGLFHRWLAEENGLYLYRLTAGEMRELEGLPIQDFEGWEADYGAIYRSQLGAMRQMRHEVKKKRIHHRDTENTEKTKEGGTG